MNSRDFLEASTVLWVLLGYSVLFSGLTLVDRRLVSRRRTAVAGVLFGLALLTKENAAFVTLLPLGICFVLGWALPRTRSAFAGVVALIMYAPYPWFVYVIGDWDTFLNQKLNGVWRMVGLLQVTGFNQQGGPSLLETLIHRLDKFATTYALLATGAVAICLLLLTDLGTAPARRLLLTWTSSAYAYLAYAMVFGTLEEHFYYYLIVPCILVTSVTTFLLIGKMRADNTGSRSTSAAPRVRAKRLALVEAGAVIFAVALAFWGAYTWVLIHAVPDNGYEHVASYIDHLPEDSRVAVTSVTAAHIMPDRGEHYSVETLRADNIEYVVISSYLAERGWNEPAAEIYQWVKGHGQLVYGFEGDSSGLLGVWRLQNRTDYVTNSARSSI
jgi:hypothetical protein